MHCHNSSLGHHNPPASLKELLKNIPGWTGPIRVDHIEMFDPTRCEMRLVVGLVVQPDDTLNVVYRKVAEDTLETLVKSRSLSLLLYRLYDF